MRRAMGISSYPISAMFRKLEGYCATVGNCDLSVLAVRADCGGISVVNQPPRPKQARREIELIISWAPWEVRETCLQAP